MTKNELIKKLQSIEGNPVVLLNDIELGYHELKNVREEIVHQSRDRNTLEEYIDDCSYLGSEYYTNHYNKEKVNAVVLTLSLRWLYEDN